MSGDKCMTISRTTYASRQCDGQKRSKMTQNVHTRFQIRPKSDAADNNGMLLSDTLADTSMIFFHHC